METNTDNTEPIPEPTSTIEQPTLPLHEFQCQTCAKSFKSAPALRMHHIRKHTKGWSTGDNFKNRGKKKPLYKSNSAAYRRKEYQKLQAFYRSKGLDSHGKPYKTEWGRRIGLSLTKAPAAGNNITPRNQGNNPGVNNPVVTFCPRCGCNIRNVAAAIAFGDKHQ